jgi:valyl-tRNA synthetase
MNTSDILGKDIMISQEELTFAEEWIIGKLNKTIDTVNHFYDNYEFGEVARIIYNFTWNDFASWYVEMTKLSDSITTKKVLVYVLTKILQLLHPFMPFVTEEIYQKLGYSEKSIMISKWPQSNAWNFDDSLHKDWFFDLIKEVRVIRNEYQVPLSKPIDLFLQTNELNLNFIKTNQKYLEKFLNPGRFVANEKVVASEDAISIILAEVQVFIPLGSLVNISEEIVKLKKKKSDLENEISRCERMLSNSSFIMKAPESKINEEKDKLVKYQENYKEVISRIRELES